MMNPQQMGTFEETFGDNKGNDAMFFLDDDEPFKIAVLFLRKFLLK